MSVPLGTVQGYAGNAQALFSQTYQLAAQASASGVPSADTMLATGIALARQVLPETAAKVASVVQSTVSGAEQGAALGTILGPYGTAVGAAVGAILGLMAGLTGNFGAQSGGDTRPAAVQDTDYGTLMPGALLDAGTQGLLEKQTTLLLAYENTRTMVGQSFGSGPVVTTGDAAARLGDLAASYPQNGAALASAAAIRLESWSTVVLPPSWPMLVSYPQELGYDATQRYVEEDTWAASMNFIGRTAQAALLGWETDRFFAYLLGMRTTLKNADLHYGTTTVMPELDVRIGILLGQMPPIVLPKQPGLLGGGGFFGGHVPPGAIKGNPNFGIFRGGLPPSAIQASPAMSTAQKAVVAGSAGLALVALVRSGKVAHLLRSLRRRR